MTRGHDSRALVDERHQAYAEAAADWAEHAIDCTPACSEMRPGQGCAEGNRRGQIVETAWQAYYRSRSECAPGATQATL